MHKKLLALVGKNVFLYLKWYYTKLLKKKRMRWTVEAAVVKLTLCKTQQPHIRLFLPLLTETRLLQMVAPLLSHFYSFFFPVN